jgi:hypothetical protein
VLGVGLLWGRFRPCIRAGLGQTPRLCSLKSARIRPGRGHDELRLPAGGGGEVADGGGGGVHAQAVDDRLRRPQEPGSLLPFMAEEIALLTTHHLVRWLEHPGPGQL